MGFFGFPPGNASVYRTYLPLRRFTQKSDEPFKMNTTQMTDAQLTIAYQATQTSTYMEEIYQRYYKKIYRYAMRLTQKEEAAYEVTADTFLKLIEKIDTLKNPEAISSWLYRIARNTFLTQVRKQKRIPLLSIQENAIDLESHSNQEHSLKEEQLNALFFALNDIGPDLKQLLIDKYLKEKTIVQLEEETGLSKSAIKMRLSRGRAKVAAMMALKIAS